MTYFNISKLIFLIYFIFKKKKKRKVIQYFVSFIAVIAEINVIILNYLFREQESEFLLIKLHDIFFRRN